MVNKTIKTSGMFDVDIDISISQGQPDSKQIGTAVVGAPLRWRDTLWCFLVLALCFRPGWPVPVVAAWSPAFGGGSSMARPLLLWAQQTALLSSTANLNKKLVNQSTKKAHVTKKAKSRGGNCEGLGCIIQTDRGMPSAQAVYCNHHTVNRSCEHLMYGCTDISWDLQITQKVQCFSQVTAVMAGCAFNCCDSLGFCHLCKLLVTITYNKYTDL